MTQLEPRLPIVDVTKNAEILCDDVLTWIFHHVTECWNPILPLFWDVIICILFSFGGVGI